MLPDHDTPVIQRFPIGMKYLQPLMDLPVDEEKRALYEIGKALFSKNGYEEIGMDHFSLKSDSLYKAAEQGELHRNFMGYTHGYTQLMIGLGVSSISDTWYAYAQNVKKVEEYYALIDNGQLPIFKGHLLNEEDLIVRKHILNIICKFQTSWDKPIEKLAWMDEALDRLKELEKDKLIELSPFHLNVKDSARPFIRNICMAFDAKLSRNTPFSTIFSSIV
jgi:oxygen-independent coproporphyrinogen-3 oxidase